jgi:hypothetical protein
MKTYVGIRDPDGVCRVTVDGKALNPRLDLRNHSPTGFEWGYSGSGPAQLALALCADVTGEDDRAVNVYQHFKNGIVSGMAKSGWEFSEAAMLTVIEKIEEGQRKS